MVDEDDLSEQMVNGEACQVYQGIGKVNEDTVENTCKNCYSSKGIHFHKILLIFHQYFHGFKLRY